ncbi:hypothetical protein BGZ68_004698 [Mortierella alpina]|nr:hypothetical protein BGZ68_004698 [Mortierella alpina]
MSRQEEAIRRVTSDSTAASLPEQHAPQPPPSLVSAASIDPATHHDHHHSDHPLHPASSTSTSISNSNSNSNVTVHAAYRNPLLLATPPSSASNAGGQPALPFVTNAAQFIPTAPTAPCSDTSAPLSSRTTALSALTADTTAAQPIIQVPASAWRFMQELSAHLALQGLFEGSGSDLRVKAFGTTYRLHRLILTQSAFFERMLNGPWKEHSLDQVDLHFDDANITRESFEIAIRRLYGVWTGETECTSGERLSRGQEASGATALTPANVMAVLASATYLGLDSLCDQCTVYAIRTLSTEYVAEYIQFSHRHNYHPWSSRIAQACHAFLCRHGFEDPAMGCLHVFERIPIEWLATVIASHAFWVPSEWDRYMFCRQVVRRRRSRICQLQGDLPNELSKHADEEVYQQLFSTGIVYMHMTFEQLRAIMDDRDPSTGLPYIEPHILQQALWQQVELRTLVDGARREDCALNVTVPEMSTAGNQDAKFEPVPERDKAAADVLQRAFDHHAHAGGAEATPLTFPLGSSAHEGVESGPKMNVTRYSLYAPFRFSVAFKVDSLRENVRVYSNTVFYAGSYWNVYIQKLPPAQQGIQLGVYLHRQPWPENNTTSKRMDLSSSVWSSRLASQPRVSLPQEHRPSHTLAQPTRVGRTRSQADEQGLDPSSHAEDGQGRDQNHNLDTAKIKSDNRVETGALNHLEDHNQAPDCLDFVVGETHAVSIEDSFSCYVDKREKTRTWFRIFAVPIKPAHGIMQFQSSPDDFAIMQSWGWRSADLCSDLYLPKEPSPGCDMDATAQTACAGGVGHDLAHAPDYGISLASRTGKLKDYTGGLTTAESSGKMQTSLDRDRQERDTIHVQDRPTSRCHCEALKHGALSERHRHLYHRQRPSSQTLKFSIVMGHT